MPLGEANSRVVGADQKSQLKTNRHADFPVLIPSQDRLLPGCRLLAANILNHISKRGLAGKCYSFPVGFFFQKERAPLLPKILGAQAVQKVHQKES
jgi:hypothetical protein